MRKQMVLQLPSQWFGMSGGPGTESLEDASASWILRDDERPAGSLYYGSLRDAASQAVGARVTVLVPTEDVLLAEAELPTIKGQKQLAKAVPFALEEQLASDVEDLHVAIGSRDKQGKIANAVVSRNSLENWLAQLKSAGLHPDVVSPEVFGVQWDKEAEATQWCLVIDGTHALMRTGPQAGLAFDSENVNAVFQASLDSAGDSLPKSLTVIGCGGDLEDLFENSAIQNDLSALCSANSIELSFHQYDERCGIYLAQGFDERNAINLLQGDYSHKEQVGKMFRPWQPALILGVVWLFLQAGVFIADYSRLSSLAEEQRAEMATIFQQALPGSRLVAGSEKELMTRALNKLRGGGNGNNSLLTLLAQSGKIFKETSGASLQSLRFKDGKLDVGLNLSDLQSLDKLKQRLKDEAKLSVEIISASSRNGKVESRLMLSGGGA